jgi:potassium-transporting ATPase KdpC subunit
MVTRTLRPALTLLVTMSLALGLAYPAVITAIAAVAFPRQAAGSLIERDWKLLGSRLIGQNFSAPGYFWGRPSASGPHPYDGMASSGSNLGPMNPALTDRIKASVEALRKADPGNTAPVPVDLVTASASGLDPEISLAAASYQAARVARARGLPLERVQALIDSHRKDRVLGYLGEPRVNVLDLNVALDQLH